MSKTMYTIRNFLGRKFTKYNPSLTFSERYFDEQVLQFELYGEIGYIYNNTIVVYTDLERFKSTKKHPHFHLRELTTQKDCAISLLEPEYLEYHYNTLYLTDDQKYQLQQFLSKNEKFKQLLFQWNLDAEHLFSGLRKIKNDSVLPDYTKLR